MISTALDRVLNLKGMVYLKRIDLDKLLKVENKDFVKLSPVYEGISKVKQINSKQLVLSGLLGHCWYIC